MSLKIVDASSNLVSKSLNTITRGVNTTDKLAEMIEDQVNLAFIESKKEVFVEANKLTKDNDGLTDEQVTYLKSLY